MKTIAYVVGLLVAGSALFFAYTGGGYHSDSTFYVAAIASTYIAFSSVAFVVTQFGRTRNVKGWVFFSTGIILLFGYLPSLRYLVSLFYVPRPFEDMRVDYHFFFYAPMIVSALCIYRGISLWADENAEEKRPNKSPEPTPTAVTPRAAEPKAK